MYLDACWDLVIRFILGTTRVAIWVMGGRLTNFLSPPDLPSKIKLRDCGLMFRVCRVTF